MHARQLHDGRLCWHGKKHNQFCRCLDYGFCCCLIVAFANGRCHWIGVSCTVQCCKEGVVITSDVLVTFLRRFRRQI